jgi:hypothetical protein
MADIKSFKPKTSTYSLKICAICGKRDDKHMKRHFEIHGNIEIVLWDQENQLSGIPWCSNWQDFIKDPKAKAQNIVRTVK